MARVVELIDYVPQVLKQSREFQYICETEDKEFNSLWELLEQCFNDQFVYTATVTGIKRWESILNILPNTSDTLDERRLRIMNVLNARVPYTMRALKDRLETMVDQSYIHYSNDTYTLDIFTNVISDKQLNEIKKTLEEMIPVNISINYHFL